MLRLGIHEYAVNPGVILPHQLEIEMRNVVTERDQPPQDILAAGGDQPPRIRGEGDEASDVRALAYQCDVLVPVRTSPTLTPASGETKRTDPNPREVWGRHSQKYKERRNEASTMYYGILAFVFLVVCVVCWMRGSWIRAFSIISTIGSAIACYYAARPISADAARATAEIMVAVCILVTFMATMFRRQKKHCPECFGTEFGYEYAYAERETDPPLVWCKRCNTVISQ